MVLKDVPSDGTGVDIEELQQEEAIFDLKYKDCFLQTKLLKSDSKLGSLIILLGTVHTRSESLQNRLRDM